MAESLAAEVLRKLGNAPQTAASETEKIVESWKSYQTGLTLPNTYGSSRRMLRLEDIEHQENRTFLEIIPGLLPERQLFVAVEKGLPYLTLWSIEEAGFSKDEIDQLIVHREVARAAGKLTVDESDRAVRLLRIQSLAEHAFGDSGKAAVWLRRPHHELNNEAPIQAARTEVGGRLVENLLAKIMYGAAA